MADRPALRRPARAVAVLLALLVAGSGVPAGANGTNTTYPVDCAANDHPAGCWGNIRLSDVFAGMGKPETRCPNNGAIAAIIDIKNAVAKQIDAGHYQHYWMIPQGLAGGYSLLFAQMADAERQCADASDDPVEAARMHALQANNLSNALDWARTAGSTTYFKRYLDLYFSVFNALANDPNADNWARQYVQWTKHNMCRAQDPDEGPEDPDYGRLFTWDDYHADGCDNYGYE